MKKLLTLASALLLAGSLYADKGKGKDRDEGPGEGRPPHGEEGIEEMGGRMKKHLGLSDEQAKKLKEVGEKNAPVMKASHRKLRDLMAKLEDQVDDKAADAALEATLADLKAAAKELQAAMEKARDEKAAILNPTQRAKAALMMGHAMGKGMGKGMSMRKHGRPGPGDDGGEGDDDDDEHEGHGREDKERGDR